ncbi:MAG: hypothetical protein R2731_03815 [Nocardioides sp.]
MTAVSALLRRWRVAHHEAQSVHRGQAHARTHAVLAAHGLDFYPAPTHSELPESLVVALRVATESRWAPRTHGVPLG